MIVYNKIDREVDNMKSLRDQIYETIRDQITYGKVHPGERLIETDLAQQFKSSRSPIREALRQLESEGLLRSENNKGYTVAKLSTRDVDEIYDIRIILEGYAVRLAAASVTEKQIKYLDRLNVRLRQAATKGELKAWLDENRLFHGFFYDNCGNSNLSLILQMLHRRIHRYLYTIIQIPGNFPTYLEQHEGIVDGCRQGDPEKAASYMRAHLQTVREVTLSYLNQFPVM
jgi:DNA-binding GntR family transcriptional regulator